MVAIFSLKLMKKVTTIFQFSIYLLHQAKEQHDLAANLVRENYRLLLLALF